MKREDVIRIAKEAGAWGSHTEHAVPYYLTQFTKLVEQATLEQAAYAGEVLGFLLTAPSQTTENSIKEVMGLVNKLVTAEFISEYSGSEEEDIEAEVLIIKCRKSIESKLRELLQ